MGRLGLSTMQGACRARTTTRPLRVAASRRASSSARVRTLSAERARASMGRDIGWSRADGGELHPNAIRPQMRGYTS